MGTQTEDEKTGQIFKNYFSFSPSLCEELLLPHQCADIDGIGREESFGYIFIL